MEMNKAVTENNKSSSTHFSISFILIHQLY